MDMLQTVIRPSIESARMASPVYSIDVAGGAGGPDPADQGQDQVLGGDPGRRARPSKRTSIVRGRDWTMHWVASTCSTSLVPMPKASAPNAPWVEVWESPQTMIMPGWVSPSSGPITCTMPCSGLVQVEQLDAELAGVPDQRRHLAGRDLVGDGEPPVAGGDVVVDGGDREVGPADPAARQPEPLERLGRGDLVDQVQVHVQQRRARSGGSPGRSTTWASQTFSNRVRGCRHETVAAFRAGRLLGLRAARWRGLALLRPGHHRPELGAHPLDLVVPVGLAHPLEVGAAGPVLGQPLAGERAVLDLRRGSAASRPGSRR